MTDPNEQQVVGAFRLVTLGGDDVSEQVDGPYEKGRYETQVQAEMEAERLLTEMDEQYSRTLNREPLGGGGGEWCEVRDPYEGEAKTLPARGQVVFHQVFEMENGWPPVISTLQVWIETAPPTDEPDIDARVRGLVHAINRLPGLKTYVSCGGTNTRLTVKPRPMSSM